MLIDQCKALLFIGAVIGLVGCTEQPEQKPDNNQPVKKITQEQKTSNNQLDGTLESKQKHAAFEQEQVVYVDSLDELYALFKKHRYTNEEWQSGHREVPPFTFERVNETWQHSSSSLPVAIKKEVFFRLMAPLVLLANEEVLALRELVINNQITEADYRALLIKYRVISKSFDSTLTKTHKQTLLKRLDIVPPSLALAQAAEESGWATSRFTLEGNAFFGQWDYSGRGMKPKAQRKELGNYGIARFDSPLDSVRGYLLNLNRGSAYQKLRNKRLELREQGQLISGLELVTTLDKYSERGQAYIDSISSMIRYNKLMTIDEASLATGPTITIKSHQQ
ncbi:glucosaminidase domain-containing protein [Thalassotalea sp. LPB0316]|uniref:glucosaminidase domain-containing protein n=1 Tax=Thalassotalea sp. LPB0316 TaxID=2769490 RepID=UPI0018667495|nr:glucosaminidase domain-containing protein [Thalassotalea sp. LPB0316]QOL24734.1 glucosaminidase domain-containing protein [Thalassotalea sp. LPB0316]